MQKASAGMTETLNELIATWREYARQQFNFEPLKPYVRHKPSCPEFFNVRFKPEPGWVTQSQTAPCNCGLAEVLAGIARQPPLTRKQWAAKIVADVRHIDEEGQSEGLSAEQIVEMALKLALAAPPERVAGHRECAVNADRTPFHALGKPRHIPSAKGDNDQPRGTGDLLWDRVLARCPRCHSTKLAAYWESCGQCGFLYDNSEMLLDRLYLEVNEMGGGPVNAVDGPVNTLILDVLQALRRLGAIDIEVERR